MKSRNTETYPDTQIHGLFTILTLTDKLVSSVIEHLFSSARRRLCVKDDNESE